MKKRARSKVYDCLIDSDKSKSKIFITYDCLNGCGTLPLLVVVEGDRNAERHCFLPRLPDHEHQLDQNQSRVTISGIARAADMYEYIFIIYMFIDHV